MEIVNADKAKDGMEYVYFANFESGFVKIGYTSHPQRRLKEVERASRIKIKDYFFINGGYDMELKMHKIFKDHRMYAEWFKIDYQYIKKFVECYEHKNKNERPKKKKHIVKYNGKEMEYKKYVNMIAEENNIEREIVSTQARCMAVVVEMIKGRIKKDEIIINELIESTIRYIQFISKCSIVTGDEEEIINENKKMIADLARIGFIEVSDTEGKDDKQIYQMVRAWLDKEATE